MTFWSKPLGVSTISSSIEESSEDSHKSSIADLRYTFNLLVAALLEIEIDLG